MRRANMNEKKWEIGIRQWMQLWDQNFKGKMKLFLRFRTTLRLRLKLSTHGWNKKSLLELSLRSVWEWKAVRSANKFDLNLMALKGNRKLSMKRLLIWFDLKLMLEKELRTRRKGCFRQCLETSQMKLLKWRKIKMLSSSSLIKKSKKLQMIIQNEPISWVGILMMR